MISISIDIAGSTAAKQEIINNLSKQDVDEAYGDFYKQFLSIESRFYNTLLLSSSMYAPPDWRKLFVVKSIGDEVWVTYDTSDDEHEIRNISAKLLRAAINITSSTIQVHLARDEAQVASRAKNKISSIVHLPMKITMDLITDAYETSKERESRFDNGVLRGLLGKYEKQDQAQLEADYVTISNRLAVSARLQQSQKVISLRRTDYIGAEIDQFFRITKEAVPGVVLIGPSLLPYLSNGICSKDSDGLESISLQYRRDPRIDGMTTDPPLNYLSKTIPAGELKGISRDIDVRYYFTQHEFLSSYQMATDAKPYGSVIQLLPENLQEKFKKCRNAMVMGRGEIA